MLPSQAYKDHAATETPAEPPHPGITSLKDGAGAVVWTELLASQGAFAHPIPPSTPLVEEYRARVASGATNAWGERPTFLEPESEHSAASACEGFALAGGRATSFASGHGLVLMKEVLSVIAGKRLPCVFHVAARSLTWHAANLHAGHDDVFAVAESGWGILFARSAQEAADLALIARATAEASGTPFLVVQDGFITTHALETLRLPEPDLVRELLGTSDSKVPFLMNPSRPVQTGTVQDEETFMRGRLAHRQLAREAELALRKTMDRYAGLSGRRYDPIAAHRVADADVVLVALGSIARTAEVAADRARERGIAAGVLHLTALRPFPGPQLASLLAGASVVAVVERLDAPLGHGNPLAVAVKAALGDAATMPDAHGSTLALPRIYEGVAGLGGRDVTVGELEAVFAHVARRPPARSFVVGPREQGALKPLPEPEPEGYVLRGHSLGGLGSLTTNRLLAAILWRVLGQNVRAWPWHGPDRRGMPTTYHLVISPRPPRATCAPAAVDFVAVHHVMAFEAGDPLAGVRDGGCLYVQGGFRDGRHLWASLPGWVREQATARKLHVIALDAQAIARALAPRPDLEPRFQGVALAGAFLRAAAIAEPLRVMGAEELWETVERAIARQFKSHGDEMVDVNIEVIRRGFEQSILVDASAPEGAS